MGHPASGKRIFSTVLVLTLLIITVVSLAVPVVYASGPYAFDGQCESAGTGASVNCTITNVPANDQLWVIDQYGCTAPSQSPHLFSAPNFTWVIDIKNCDSTYVGAGVAIAHAQNTGGIQDIVGKATCSAPCTENTMEFFVGPAIASMVISKSDDSMGNPPTEPLCASCQSVTDQVNMYGQQSAVTFVSQIGYNGNADATVLAIGGFTVYPASGGNCVHGQPGLGDGTGTPAVASCAAYELNPSGNTTAISGITTGGANTAIAGVRVSASYGSSVPVVVTTIVPCSWTSLNCWIGPLIFLGCYDAFFFVNAMARRVSTKGMIYMMISGFVMGTIVGVLLGLFGIQLVILSLLTLLIWWFRFRT